ncbi:MAG: hypothetical protein JWR90_3534 [Marmoricola sp.]|jgi:hypothetical protein|nr:hypothetical protein [Marmoricola sp.]
MPQDEEQPAARPQRERARDARTGHDAAASRIQHQARWVDLQIQQAMERGEFDDLPGKGKPLGDLGAPHDRDWWLKKLIEREQITVLPEALMLRKEDAELDARLDRETAEKVVWGILEDFNRRIVAARRQLQGGPPVVTPTRDVEVEVEQWRERQRAKRQAVRAETAQERTRRRWFRRWFRR